MEAVTISIAKIALNSVVKTATTTITNEIGLLLGVQEELFFIKEELEMMQGFLQAASTEKEKGIVVSIWVKQVQELAFDVEDCLQEASIHLMKKNCLPVMCSVKKRDDIATKVRILKTRIEDVSKRNLRYELIKKDYSGHTYDENASTISITNVEGLLVGLDEPRRKLVELILKEHGEVISVVGMGGLGKTTLVREVYGCQEVRDEFKNFVWVTIQHPFNTEEFIESMAKQITPNAQEDDTEGGTVQRPKKTIKEMVIEYLQDKKYLVVLDDLSNASEWAKIKDVLPNGNGRRIIVTTRLKPLAESISCTSDNIYELKQLLESDAFELFYRAVYRTSSFHLMIDNREMKDDSPHESKCIKENGPNSTEIKRENVFSLFWKAIYKTPNYPLVGDDGPSSTEIKREDSEEQKKCITNPITEDMNTQAGLILNSCGLLPLAIVTIGSYLATKPKTSAEWKKMRDQLSSELNNNPDLGVVKTVLTSSYDGLPYHLKPSLLYLSVFHNHKEIRRSRIIRRWMADGYVMQGHKKTAEEVGNGYFYDLMGRSLIQPPHTSTIVNGEVKKCNIHDIVHELILAKAVDENMVSLLEDENLITKTDKVRHLVITGGPCKDDKVLKKVTLSHMRSLSIFGEVGVSLKYSKMKLIRVLDLECTLDLNNRDLRSVGKLRHLKYLGLRGTKITELPDSLGKLSELETLDIRNTAVFRLPTAVTKLHKLSYLRAGFESFNNSNIGMSMTMKDSRCAAQIGESIALLLCCVLLMWNLYCHDSFGTLTDGPVRSDSYGVRVPHGIGELRSLNILGTIDISQSKSLANELQNLTNLSKLAVTGFSEENGKILAKVIDGLKHLRSLVLSAADETSGLGCCLGSVSSPPKYLRSLKLYSPLGELPDWISSVENLEKIHLRNTCLTKDIRVIENLPNLKFLYMLCNSLKDVKELCFVEGTFPMLHVLILEDLNELELVSIENSAFKRLEHLKISNCESIVKGGVSGLEFLVQLKVMEVVITSSVLGSLFGSWIESERNSKKFVSNLQEKLSMHPTKPVLRVIKR